MSTPVTAPSTDQSAVLELSTHPETLILTWPLKPLPETHQGAGSLEHELPRSPCTALQLTFLCSKQALGLFGLTVHVSLGLTTERQNLRMLETEPQQQTQMLCFCWGSDVALGEKRDWWW